MSDPTSKRQITGLDMLVRSRRPDVVEIPDPPAVAAEPAIDSATALDRMRGAAPEATSTMTAAQTRPQAVKEPRSRAPRPNARTGPARPQKAVQRPEDDSPRDRVSAYVSADTANRAKNAFRATGHLEGDASFSEFIETAIIRELERREQLHNDGHEYSTDSGKLSAGRPLGS
jgi:hypothetical protein